MRDVCFMSGMKCEANGLSEWDQRIQASGACGASCNWSVAANFIQDEVMLDSGSKTEKPSGVGDVMEKQRKH